VPIDYVALGATLRAAREAKKLRQSDVAKKLNMTAANVSSIERGKSKTSLHNLEAYASLVGCRLAVLLAPADDPRALLTARLMQVLPDLEEPLFDTLNAWVDIWEARARERRGARPA
jgi:transcriptional regulator with XRE-family HTH domain